MDNKLKLDLIEVLKKLAKYNSENIYELYFQVRTNKNVVQKMSKRDMLILRVVLFEANQRDSDCDDVLLKYITEKLKKLTNLP